MLFHDVELVPLRDAQEIAEIGRPGGRLRCPPGLDGAIVAVRDENLYTSRSDQNTAMEAILRG